MKFTILVVPYMRSRGEKVGLAGRDRKRFQILVDQVRRQMQFAEERGYTGFCMTEQHMQIEGIETTTNPLFWNYFIAQHTKHMKVGQLGMNLTAVNPIQLAEDIALLDHFTDGRLFIGFSRGNTPRWTAMFGQHIGISSTESDRSEADQRNRRAFYENWHLVKALWTQDTVRVDGEFWKTPDVEWAFQPTIDWAPQTITDGKLKEIGIVPRPLQDPYPTLYAPFSYSMETARFWAREGAKMVSFVAPEYEKFLPITLDEYKKVADATGRAYKPNEALGIGGHLVLGRNPAETKDIVEGFLELFNWAYDAPPYNVPVGRLWTGSRQEVLDHVADLERRYGTDEIFLWHHVGYFPEEVEFAMLAEFSEAVIKPINGRL